MVQLCAKARQTLVETHTLPMEFGERKEPRKPWGKGWEMKCGSKL